MICYQSRFWCNFLKIIDFNENNNLINKNFHIFEFVKSLYSSFQYIADIEEHLGVTIDQVGVDLKIPVNEFDGKVTYGKKQRGTGKHLCGTYILHPTHAILTIFTT